MPATYDLTGKTAVVTGGARGIGRLLVAHMRSADRVRKRPMFGVERT
jgi:hypothetical protein